MPPSTRRTRSDTPRAGAPHDEAHDAGPPGREEPVDVEHTPPEHGERTTMTLRLPFLTLSLTRPHQPPAHGAGEQARRRRPGTAEAQVADRGSGERLLFYTGVAALGVAGVLEWPVAAAIAAGTYIAAKTRSTPPRPVPGGSADTRSAGAASTEVAVAPKEVTTSPDA
jgi:hypothetical protein